MRAQNFTQALIYPITVASKTSSRPRQEAAGAVMADMRKYNPVLVEEASLVSREMIKVTRCRSVGDYASVLVWGNQ